MRGNVGVVLVSCLMPAALWNMTNAVRAADLDVIDVKARLASMSAPVASWRGFYVGINAGGGNELGDYVGLDFYDSVLYPCWADNSNSTGDNPDGTGNFDYYGARVTVVEMAGTLLPAMDPDLGRELERAFRRQGIEVLTGHRYERLERKPPGAEVVVVGPAGPRTLVTASVLVAVGRLPLSGDLGLEEAAVQTRGGFVVVDPYMRTSADGVYAIGDLVGPLLLAHAASEQGVIAVEAMASQGANGREVDPTRVPICIYCLPEVAAVGLTEVEARSRGYEVRVGKFPFRALGKAMASGHTEGFVKIVSEERYRAVLGVHMIGAGVTELIAEAGLARSLEATTTELVGTIHAHPTLAEAFREAALDAEGRAINA